MKNANEKMKVEKLGYDIFFESKRKDLGLENFSIARVIAEYKGAYKIKNLTGERLATITGKQMFKALSREDYPAVGDWVAVTELDAERAVIHQILPRKTTIKRKYSGKNETQIIATNIDQAFVVESVGRDYNLNRFERYFAIIKESGIEPGIVLNKIDLISKSELNQRSLQIKNRFQGIDAVFTSVASNQGIDELRAQLEKGKTYCFLGSSGVGKSSLINKLLGKEEIETKEISPGNQRGRHVTTKREMYFLKNGAIVIDNPGMREVGLAETAGLDDLFNDITFFSKNCHYADCSHVHEPGCQVLAAVNSGQLNREQYQNYINLKKEAGYYQMTKIEKKEKDRQFGKFIKTAKKQIKEYKGNYF